MTPFFPVLYYEERKGIQKERKRKKIKRKDKEKENRKKGKENAKRKRKGKEMQGKETFPFLFPFLVQNLTKFKKSDKN